MRLHLTLKPFSLWKRNPDPASAAAVDSHRQVSKCPERSLLRRKDVCFRMFLIMAAALIIRGGCVCMFCAQPDTESGTQAGDRLSAALPEEYTKSMDRLFAREFSVDYYGEDYTLIVIHSQFRYLLVEEGAEIPEDLPEDVTILQKPFSHIYAASSSCPDFFRELHALDRVTMTSTKAEDWTSRLHFLISGTSWSSCRLPAIWPGREVWHS